jgi:hypothetical protein
MCASFFYCVRERVCECACGCEYVCVRACEYVCVRVCVCVIVRALNQPVSDAIANSGVGRVILFESFCQYNFAPHSLATHTVKIFHPTL